MLLASATKPGCGTKGVELLPLLCGKGKIKVQMPRLVILVLLSGSRQPADVAGSTGHSAIVEGWAILGKEQIQVGSVHFLRRHVSTPKI